MVCTVRIYIWRSTWGKKIQYHQKTMVNYSSHQLTVNTLSLKKMFYHQVPLSFNYYLRPHLSVGTGSVYNILYKAISNDKRITTDYANNQQQTITTQILATRYNDSFFYRSTFQWLLQAQYDWKRWEVGLRYQKDVQPFMKYIKPTGEKKEEKSSLLNILVRFRLYKPGKKK